MGVFVKRVDPFNESVLNDVPQPLPLGEHDGPEGEIDGSLGDGQAGSLNYMIVAIGTGCLVMVALLAAVALRCFNSWKCSAYYRHKDDEDTNSSKTNIRISHSLPDLTQDISKHEYIQEVKEKKIHKVLRQTTLPTVPSRLQSFHRQLSQKLENTKEDFVTRSLQRQSLRRRTEESIGLIQPELYRNELVRQSSTDSTADTAEKVGRLQFSLMYDRELETLVVKVIQAFELPVKDMCGSSDPYIKIYLLPDRKKKHQTKVHRRNLNPAFNETFHFSVAPEDLPDRYLQFSVYDFDRFSRHDLIGHVFVKGMLDANDLIAETDYNLDILAPPKDKKDLGELMISLCYLPTAGRLTVTIIKARNLKAMDITGSSDPFTKVYLTCQGKKIRKRKTTIRRCTLFPVWNESLVFDVPSQNVQDVQVIFKVIDFDRLGQNDSLGCAAAGLVCLGMGRDHWIEMLDCPRRPVAQWYPLQESVIPGCFPEGSYDNLSSPPDSPFVKRKSRSRHLSWSCLQEKLNSFNSSSPSTSSAAAAAASATSASATCTPTASKTKRPSSSAVAKMSKKKSKTSPPSSVSGPPANEKKSSKSGRKSK